jgi:hypothetical protein
MATVTRPATSLPDPGDDLEAEPIRDYINNVLTFLEGNNIDDANVDFTSTDGIMALRKNQTVTGIKTHTGNIVLSGTATFDLNGIANALILDADADTHISAPTDDQIDIAIGGTDLITLATAGSTFSHPVTVGVDDTGYDVKFFGATTGKYMLWDESADTLAVVGTAITLNGTAVGDASVGTANTWSADQTFNDNVKVTLGTGGDADLYYDGTNVVLTPDVVGSGVINLNGQVSVPLSHDLIIGDTTGITVEGQIPALQVLGTDTATGSMTIANFSASANGPHLKFLKSRNASIGGNTVPNNGDVIGGIQFHVADGGDFVSRGAAIYALINGTPGVNDVPTDLIFATAADGTAADVERMRIDSSGIIGLNMADADQDASNFFSAGQKGLATYGGDGQSSKIVIVSDGTGGDEQSGQLGFAEDDDAVIAGYLNYLHNGNAMIFGTAAAERMRIDSSGNVGIGTPNPSGFGGMLAVNADLASGYGIVMANDGNNANRYGLRVQAGADDASGTTYYLMAQDGDGHEVGYIANTSGTFAITDSSDERLKENIIDSEIDGLAVINALNVSDFTRSRSQHRVTAGFIAQQVQEVYPQAVPHPKTPDAYLGVMKDALIGPLVLAVQKLTREVNALKGAS